MHKYQKIALIVTALIIGLIVNIFLSKPKRYMDIEVEGNWYRLEVAETPQEKAKGLMGVDYLPKDRGMVFIYEKEGFHSFWMYKTLIPLDIIWLDSDWDIVHKELNVPPCFETNPQKCPNYVNKIPARYVIELNGGTLKEKTVSPETQE